ncbi:MAG: hypothetical protein JWQ76_2845 [Ramlibacter sp.]|nr:hypothetical protein [Ramlibacter sp.]
MNQPSASPTRPPPQGEARKRHYSSPELREYGSAPILTQSAAKNTNKDGGANNIKT